MAEQSVSSELSSQDHKAFIESNLKTLRAPFTIAPAECPSGLPLAVVRTVLNKINEQIKADAVSERSRSSVEDLVRQLESQASAARKRKADIGKDLAATVSKLPEVWNASGARASEYQKLRSEVSSLDRSIAAARSTRDHYKALVDELGQIDAEALRNNFVGTESALQEEIDQANQLVTQIHKALRADPRLLRVAKRRALDRAEAQQVEDDLAVDASLLFEHQKLEEDERKLAAQERKEQELKQNRNFEKKSSAGTRKKRR